MNTEKAKIGIVLDQDPPKEDIKVKPHAINVMDLETTQADNCLKLTIEKAKIRAASVEVDLFK